MDQPKKSQFETVLLRYTRIFNLLGESGVVSFDNNSKNSILKRFIRYIPTLISLVLTIGLTILDIVFELEYFSNSQKITSVIYAIFFGTIISTKFVGISQILILEKIFPLLYQQLNELRSMTKDKYKINYQNFQYQFLQDAAIIIGTWLITFTVNGFIAHEMVDADFFVHFCVSAVVLMNRITMCHVHFYLILLKNFIAIFIDYVQQKATTIKLKSAYDLKIELLFVKVIHFKLYEISMSVNAIFGWVFIAIFIQEFVDFIYQIYWIFLLMDCSSLCNVIRNLLIDLFS